jgi:hypothetical protein
MFRLVFLGLIILTIAAIRFLSWQASFAIILVVCLLFKYLGGWLGTRLLSIPFRMKGKVLRKADVQIHSLAPAAPPTLDRNRADEDEEEPKEDEGPRNYYLLEATILPQEPKGKFRLWEPGELCLVAPGLSIDDDDDTCKVKQMEIFEEGSYHPDEGLKYPGPKRLRMLLAVAPQTPKLVFRYYFETFGDVKLPR